MLGALNFEQTRLLSKFCDGILLLDEHIVFVSVLSRHGRQLESKSKGDSAFMSLTRHELEHVYMQRMLQTQMIKDFDDKLGKFDAAIIEREFCVEGIFPFYDGMVLVVSSPNDNVKEVGKKITKSIKDFNFEIAKVSVSC
jgi:hypothetical protein